MKNFYRDGGLVLSVIAFSIVAITLSALLFFRDVIVFWIFTPFIALTAGITIVKLLRATKKTFQYLTIIKNEINSAESEALYNSPIAIGIVDKNKRFIWFNQAFVDEFKAISTQGASLEAVTAINTEQLLDSMKRVKYGEKYYNIHAAKPNIEIVKSKSNKKSRTKSETLIIYFNDVTKETLLEKEKKLSKPVVVMIIIDSYEEIFSGSSESTIASVTVQIDKILEDYIKTTNGIMKKTGRNRFWAVIEERHIRGLIDSKVKLLDKAREIAVTDRINVTLSIGIGKTGKDMAESDVFARQALEMALGRGGDQAAVKTESGFEFYGGFSKGVERHTKVKVRIIANSLIDLANKSDIVYIMGHKFSDYDSIGAAVGLACGLRNLGRPAYIVIDKRSSLGLNLIEKIEMGESPAPTSKKGGDNQPPLFIEPAKAHEAWTDNSLLIIVDTHNKKIIENQELYEKAKKVVVIDHHRKMVDFIENSVIFHHEVTASSTSEMVTELLQYFGSAGVINSTQAEALLAGIVLDTKNFSLKTGVRTFEAAAFLRKLGADTSNIKSLFAYSIDNYKLKTALVAGAAVYKRCAIASSDVIRNEIRVIAPQAADDLLKIAGIEASFLIYKTAVDEVSISARSLGEINVQVIMEALGGGGHHNMSGAQLGDVTLAWAETRLREIIDRH